MLMFVMQEAVDCDDIAVDVSSPAAYIQSHEQSVPTRVNTGDNVVVNASATVAFANIQPSNTSPAAALTHSSQSALALDLTATQLPTFEVPASKYTYFLI